MACRRLMARPTKENHQPLTRTGLISMSQTEQQQNQASSNPGSAPSGAVVACKGEKKGSARRFRLACRMLRQGGHFDIELPGQRRGESPIDWLVRLGLACEPWVAAEMLILGKGRLIELLDLLDAEGVDPRLLDHPKSKL